MNDNQFDALLAVFRDMADELMFIRDEISELRNIYGQVHGFESDAERDERIEKMLEEHHAEIKASLNDEQPKN